MKKFIHAVIFFIIAAACLLVLWSVSGYLLSFREKSKTVLPETASLRPGDSVNIGVPLQAEVSFRLPRFRKVLNCTVQLGKGAVNPEKISWKIRRHAWKYNEWHINVPICGITSGTIPAGRLTVELSPEKRGGKSISQVLVIPPLQIKPLSGVTIPDPELAGEMALPGNGPVSPYWLLLLLLIPLLLFIYYRFRHKKNLSAPLSLRAATLGTLESLRNGIFTRNVSAENAVTQLSDIIRHFLEKRYTLPLSSRTTPEFMEEIDRTAALPEEHRPFLRDFMNAADLIKFAHAPCDNASVNAAIDSAEKLVKNTTAAEENKNV